MVLQNSASLTSPWNKPFDKFVVSVWPNELSGSENGGGGGWLVQWWDGIELRYDPYL